MAGKKGTINPYMYRQFENNPLELSKYYRTLEDDHLRTMFETPQGDGTFPAVVLSGMKSDNNSGTGNDPNDAKLIDGYLWITIKPEHEFADPLGDPTQGSPDFINASMDNFAKCFRARSEFEFKNTNPPVFGQRIICYSEDGSLQTCDYTKLRYKNPESPANIHPDYFALGAVVPDPSAAGAFENGNPSLLGPLPETKPAASAAQVAFEKKLGDAIRAKGLEFHVTDRARTVDMQMNRILNKYKSRGAEEVKSAYGKNRGARMVAAIQAGDMAAFRKDAANSSRHLKGAAIDLRSKWYTNDQLKIVLAEIRKLGGNPLVEPLKGGCWEKSGRNVTNPNRKHPAGGNGRGTPCHNEHIHIDIPEGFK